MYYMVYAKKPSMSETLHYIRVLKEDKEKSKESEHCTIDKISQKEGRLLHRPNQTTYKNDFQKVPKKYSKGFCCLIIFLTQEAHFSFTIQGGIVHILPSINSSVQMRRSRVHTVNSSVQMRRLSAHSVNSSVKMRRESMQRANILRFFCFILVF